MNLEQTYYIKQITDSLARWERELSGKYAPIYPELLNFYVNCVRDAKVTEDYENPEPYIAPLVEKTLELVVKYQPVIKESLCWSLLALLNNVDLISKLKENKQSALNAACALLYIAQFVTHETNEHNEIRSIIQMWTGAIRPARETTVLQELAENLFEMPWVVLYASDLTKDGHACYEVVLETQPRLVNLVNDYQVAKTELPHDFN